MKYIQTLELDFNAAERPICIHAKQGDRKSRFVKIIPTADGISFLPDGASAVFRCEKPDGKAIFNSAEILEDHTVQIELTDSLLACPGIAQCELTLYDGNTVLSSCGFWVHIMRSVSDEAVESSDEFTQLQKIMQTYEETIKNAAVQMENNNTFVPIATELLFEEAEYEEVTENA